MTLIRAALGLAFAGTLAACAPLAGIVDRTTNRVDHWKVRVPTEIDARYRPFFTADLHADTLMWERDLLRRNEHGHVDIPRMVEGGVDLQVFTIVTRTPPEKRSRGDGETCVSANDTNLTSVLSVLQGRPSSTWRDLRARAAYQAARLEDAARRSETTGSIRLVMIKTAADLARVRNGAAAGQPIVGGVLGVEGANWIGREGDGDIAAAVQDAFDMGVRVFALTHRFNSALGGASEGCPNTLRLTEAGERALEAAIQTGLIIDLAHLSSKSLNQALGKLKEANRPPLVTHSGLAGSCKEKVCGDHRNLSDADLVAIAKAGGVVGIGFWPQAVGEGELAAIVRAFRYAHDALKKAGIAKPFKHLAFGSDFDGAVRTPYDITGMPVIIAALRGAFSYAEMSDADLANVAGLNVCRLMATQLPGGDAAQAETLCAASRTISSARP